jgi:hypothetical protein
MLGELPPKSLLVADAGFPGYELWLELLKAGHELVMRVGGNVRLLKKLGYVRSGEDIVYFWPHHAAAKRQPPLILRLVVLTGGRQPIYVLTSVLDHKRLPNRQVVNLYHLRWGIELFYRHLKQTFDRRKLRSRNGDNVHVEAQWSLLGLWTMALHAQHYQQTQGLDPERLSVAGMLRATAARCANTRAVPKPVRICIRYWPSPSKTTTNAPAAKRVANIHARKSKPPPAHPKSSAPPPPKSNWPRISSANKKG